jgi:hypothetical protein
MSVTIAILKPLVDVVVEVVVVFDVEDLLLPPQPAATEQATTRTPSASARPATPARYEMEAAWRGQVNELNGRQGTCTHASTDWHIGQRSGGVERATP